MDKKRRKSPIRIQQWVDSLPESEESELLDKTITTSPEPIINIDDKLNVIPPSTAKSIFIAPTTSKLDDMRGILSRDASFQSDDASSHCSSVESVLELRRVDPEAVLIGLGFGPSEDEDETARIPKRFLQPSRLAGVDVQRFLQQHRESKEAANNYYWPAMQSTLNIGRDFKNIPTIPLRKDSTTSFDNSS